MCLHSWEEVHLKLRLSTALLTWEGQEKQNKRRAFVSTLRISTQSKLWSCIVGAWPFQLLSFFFCLLLFFGIDSYHFATHLATLFLFSLITYRHTQTAMYCRTLKKDYCRWSTKYLLKLVCVFQSLLSLLSFSFPSRVYRFIHLKIYTKEEEKG